jgi:hypothetical protein
MRVLCVYHALPRSVLTGCPDSLHSPPPLQLASVMLEPFQNFYHEPPPACTVTIRGPAGLRWLNNDTWPRADGQVVGGRTGAARPRTSSRTMWPS